MLFTFGCIAYILLFSPLVALTDISVQGATTIPQNDVLAIVYTSSEGKVANIFSKRTFFFYPKKEIHQKLLETYPRIYAIESKRVFPDSGTLIIRERTPMLTWCSFLKRKPAF